MMVINDMQASFWDDPNSWDEEWAKDWKDMKEIFNKIEEIKTLFQNSKVPYLLEISQKQIILNLERYAGLLNNHIIKKYK